MSNKVLGLCLFGSMAAHLFFGIYMGGGFVPSGRPVSEREAITPLEYVAPPKITAPTPPAQPKPAPIYKPAPVVKSAATQKPAKITYAPEKKTQAPAPKPAPAVKSSAELLMDPQKGKIFSRYFSRIKQKIYQTVHDQYMASAVGKGNVSMMFLMSRNGTLEDVSIVNKETQAGARAREFAVQCVKEAAPFDAFPKELAADKICFNLTLVFDES